MDWNMENAVKVVPGNTSILHNVQLYTYTSLKIKKIYGESLVCCRVYLDSYHFGQL